MLDPQVGVKSEVLSILNGEDKMGMMSAALVGSAYILGYEQAQDIDVLVYVGPDLMAPGDAMKVAGKLLESQGFTESVHRVPKDSDLFVSYKRGVVSVLLTPDMNYYERFIVAAEVCKYLEVEDKTERIMVHRIIRDRMSAAEAEAMPVVNS